MSHLHIVLIHLHLQMLAFLLREKEAFFPAPIDASEIHNLMEVARPALSGHSAARERGTRARYA
jgi:hypothetical protein